MTKETATAKDTAKEEVKKPKDLVELMVERIEYSAPNGIEPPEKISKPYKHSTNARAFQNNFLKYHKTQGLTIVEVLTMPDTVKFDHKKYLEDLKVKAKAKSRR